MASGKKTFYEGIDTWRGLAALLVCVFHFALYQNVFGPLFAADSTAVRFGGYGYLGVYIFFVISGFVIPLSMFNGGYTYRKVGRFLAKRSLRIEPPYLATLFLFLAIQYVMSRWWYNPYSVDPVRVLAHTVYIVPFVKGMEWYNPIFWTLAIEFQFYLLCALLFPLWTHKNRWIRHLSLIGFLLSAWYLPDNRFVTFFAAIFGFGITLFLYRSAFVNRFETLIYLVICAVLLYNGNTLEIFVTTVLSFGLLALPDFRLKIGQFFGKISYSLYLTHGLSGGTFLMLCHKGNAEYAYPLFFAALGLSVGCAYLFYRVIEKPFHGLSRKMKL